MKKTYILFSVAIVFFYMEMNGQISQDCNGNVGIGGAPTADTRLTLQAGNSLLRFVNGNGHQFVLGNRVTSLYNAPNTFDIYDQTSDRYLMEFRQDASYIHTRLVVGVGYGNIHRNYFGFSGGAVSYDFNPNTPNTQNGYKGFLMENSAYESSGFYCDGDFGVIWTPGNYNYLLKVLDEDGMILKWYLDANGVAYSNSDKTRKEQIEAITRPLDKITQLNGITYQFIQREEEKLKNDSILSGLKDYTGSLDLFKANAEKKKSGFIAQDLEKIIPEVVQTDENGEKYVNYDGIIPYLVESIKEQQQLIQNLQLEISALKSGENALKSMGTSYTTEVHLTSDSQKNQLFQNIPNPFSSNTIIEYTLADNTTNAMICIYDLNGIQLKCVPIDITTGGKITISANEFKAGMYLYSLLVDGQLVDTKRMVLTN
jgi:hypothetical protein